MRKYFLIISLMLLSIVGNSQLLVGIQGGYNINDIYLGNSLVTTTLDGSSSFGILLTYLPEEKKPGFRISMTKTSFSIKEIGEDYSYRYQNEGYDMHFLTHMYLGFAKTKLFINAGPGMSLWTNPTPINAPMSGLPDYKSDNLNRFFVQITGGGGITQQLGKVHVSVYGHFSFTTTKFYKNLNGFSNPLITRIAGSIQIPVGK